MLSFNFCQWGFSLLHELLHCEAMAIAGATSLALGPLADRMNRVNLLLAVVILGSVPCALIKCFGNKSKCPLQCAKCTARTAPPVPSKSLQSEVHSDRPRWIPAPGQTCIWLGNNWILNRATGRFCQGQQSALPQLRWYFLCRVLTGPVVFVF